uniref:Nudix hydrolase domain-containing protein n=1 Tax=Amblyomma maculatum TaxID=34609 RepID=G3MM24_AMBMU
MLPQKLLRTCFYLSAFGLKTMRVHFKCRGAKYPGTDVLRLPVPDDKVAWTVEWPEYKPPSYSIPGLASKPWADPEIGSHFCPSWNTLDGTVDRRSHEGAYAVQDGRPQNPHGRTGLSGRGRLGRWGPNHAADPLVTRWKRDSAGSVVMNECSRLPVLQFVAIARRDSGEWAIPGGMVDPGELVSATLRREFCEEAMNSLSMSEQDKRSLEKSLELFFSKGIEVYKGYVDDPRNTDNAWMETVAFNFHDENGNITGKFSLEAGDDAAKVRWTDIDKELCLYASHSDLVYRVVQRLKAHW